MLQPDQIPRTSARNLKARNPSDTTDINMPTKARAPNETIATKLPAYAEALHETLDTLLAGQHPDPFHILGPHSHHHQTWVSVFLPNATAVTVIRNDDGTSTALVPLRLGFFTNAVPGLPIGQPDAYRLQIDCQGVLQETEDPYAFGLLLSEPDLHLISAGQHELLADCLGAHVMQVAGIPGVRFAVWAPNARRVSVVGDFNNWDGRCHVMRLRYPAGVWELFIPRLQPGTRYQYEILNAAGHPLPLKADPWARQTELPPATASIVAAPDAFLWTDATWMNERATRLAVDAPLSIYEVHVASWRQTADSPVPCNWQQLAEQLIPYVCEMGFTHLELMPIMEHPFGGSWGYQPVSLFAPSARYGTPADFATFVDRCHAAGLGLILDWVPAHFPSDGHGLGQFDGTALYEYQDPREGFHPEWHTLIYNFGRHEVRNFLVASALEWPRRYHIDALRVDGVASMLYRDYARDAGQWLPNRDGGHENLEAVDFLREMNSAMQRLCPGVLTIAEESTAWPGVTAPLQQNGLGFSYKWNMGWMNDTLRYMRTAPCRRSVHYHDMTFGITYAYAEQFILPLSHDEVVHGKGSLLNKMPGDAWQRFANLRAYFAYMWTYPGKKLLFMGGEIAQEREWNHMQPLDWQVLENGSHQGVKKLVQDLNHLYRELPALHRYDSDPKSFTWIILDDTNSIFAYMRMGGDTHVLCISNFTPMPHHNYRVGVTQAGYWHERLNTDAGSYGGSGLGNQGGCHTQAIPAHHQAQSLSLTIPPLATLVLGMKDQ
jgi:1,4-alpha-glucan branching enzyme